MKRSCTPLVTFALLVLVAGRSSLSAAETDPKELLWHPTLAAGDYDGYASHCLDFVAAHPESPDAELALRLASYHSGFLKTRRPLVARLKSMTDAGLLKGETGSIARLFLAGLLREHGDWEGSRAQAERLGQVRDWLICGPFGYTSQAVFDQEFPPETPGGLVPRESGAGGSGLAASEDRGKLREWRVLPAGDPVGETGFWAFLRPQLGAVYGLAQAESKTERDAILQFESASSFKCWWNGRLVLSGDRRSRLFANSVRVPIRLSAGWNRLLLKMTSFGAGTFRCRILEGGEPAAGLAWEKGIVLHEIAGGGDDATTTPAGLEPPSLAAVRARAEAGGAGVAAQAAFGLLAFFYGIPDDASEVLRRAVAAAPAGDPYPAYILGRVTEQNAYLSETLRRNRAYEQFTAALKADPKFRPALEGTVRYLDRDKKTEEALGLVRKALAEQPDWFTGLCLALDLCHSQGWTRETEDYVAQLDKIAPGNTKGRAYWSSRHEELKNYAAAFKAIDEMKAEAAPAAEEKRIALLIATGDAKAALEAEQRVVERNPNAVGARLGVANRLEDLGEYAKAIEALRGILALVPDEPFVRRKIGDLLMKMGDRDGAVVEYEKVLALDGSSHEIRRYLEFLRGEDEDYSKPYLIDIDTLRKDAPEARDWPKAKVVYLLDLCVVRFYEDGSFSEVVGATYKILNSQGVDDYATAETQGDLLEARIFRRDGEVLEPTLLGDSNTLTFPGVEEGAIVDYRYRVQTRAADPFQFVLPTFFFQDFRYDAPFLLSRYVVIAPKSLDLKYVERQMPQGAKVKEEGDLRTLVWEVRKSPRIEQERFMPESTELLPNVSIAAKATWGGIARVYAENFLGRTFATAELRAEAAKLAPEGDREARAKAIFAHVNDWVKEQANASTAYDTWLQKKGSRHLLMKAFFEIAGVPAQFALVRQPVPGAPPPTWELPAPGYFTDSTNSAVLLALTMEDGSRVWLDPRLRLGCYGGVGADVQGGLAFVLEDGGGGHFETIPALPNETHGLDSRVAFVVPEKGPAQGEALITMSGVQGASAKEQMLRRDARDRKVVVESIMNSFYPGMKLKSAEMPEIETPGIPFQAKAVFTFGRLIQKNGDEIVCGTGFPPVEFLQNFGGEAERKQPMILRAAFSGHHTTVITLPAGLDFDRVPADMLLPNEFGYYGVTFRREANRVTIDRRYCIPPQSIPAARYSALLQFCREVDEFEKTQLKLREVKGK